MKSTLSFQYLKQGSIKDPNLDDVKDFNRMDQSMDNVGFSREEKDNIYRVVSAVLHLGNIDFEEKDDAKGKTFFSFAGLMSLAGKHHHYHCWILSYLHFTVVVFDRF